MAIKIVEFFGYSPTDQSADAVEARRNGYCPFMQQPCSKTIGTGPNRVRSGACSIRQASSGPIIACPERLYTYEYQVIGDVARSCFGEGIRLIKPSELSSATNDGMNVVAFGKRWGGELRLPRVHGRGGYFVDWVLARVNEIGELVEFVAVEVQTIDTTGNYREERATYLEGKDFLGYSPGGMNWENVSKRILPQLIFKGHVLRRERLCSRGLYFICPSPVYNRIQDRLGRDLLEYERNHAGTITFRHYDLGPEAPPGQLRELVFRGEFTTTVDQVAVAFTAPRNLPPANVYENAIMESLKR